MTTGISLVRENTESMKPPRALWVSFPLGRPLGIPGDAAFQHEVIAGALDLLNHEQGPVLEDFPKDVPPLEADSVAACPVSFPRHEENDNSWVSRLTREFSSLEPWYELSRRRKKGRTLVGIAKESPEENIQKLGADLDAGNTPTDIKWLKPAIEDLKAYYLEAMTAQPGEYDAEAIQHQLWQETILGEAILNLYHHFQNSDDNRMKIVARLLAPRGETE